MIKKFKVGLTIGLLINLIANILTMFLMSYTYGCEHIITWAVCTFTGMGALALNILLIACKYMDNKEEVTDAVDSDANQLDSEE